MEEKKIILAFETAIESGSISLSVESSEIDFWIGEKKVSRAEDLLRETEALLVKNKIEKKEIGVIAVSKEIGSQTGLRIGLATALGLKKALGCVVAEVSVLEALRQSAEPQREICAAISNNTREVYFLSNTREKNIAAPETFELLDYDNFKEKLSRLKCFELIVNEKLYDFIMEDVDFLETFVNASIFNAGKNLSKYLGKSIDLQMRLIM